MTNEDQLRKYVNNVLKNINLIDNIKKLLINSILFDP